MTGTIYYQLLLMYFEEMIWQDKNLQAPGDFPYCAY